MALRAIYFQAILLRDPVYCMHIQIYEPEQRILAQGATSLLLLSLTSMLETEVNFPIFFIHGPTVKIGRTNANGQLP